MQEGKKSMSSQGHERVKEATSLSYDTGALSTFYDTWASQYNLDVDSCDYAGPMLACNLLAQSLNPTPGTLVVDIGCGTGLVGKKLKDAGF